MEEKTNFFIVILLFYGCLLCMQWRQSSSIKRLLWRISLLSSTLTKICAAIIYYLTYQYNLNGIVALVCIQSVDTIALLLLSYLIITIGFINIYDAFRLNNSKIPVAAKKTSMPKWIRPCWTYGTIVHIALYLTLNFISVYFLLIYVLYLYCLQLIIAVLFIHVTLRFRTLLKYATQSNVKNVTLVDKVSSKRTKCMYLKNIRIQRNLVHL